MKKIILILFAIFFIVSMAFTQTNSTVSLSDDVYKLLDISETKGLCTPLKVEKPYTQKYIVSKLEEIAEVLVNNETRTSKTELQIVRTYLDRFSQKETNIPELEFVFHNNKDNLPLTFGARAGIDGFVSGGIYTDKNTNSLGFEEVNNIGFFGDLGPYVSFDWNFGAHLTKMPLTKMKGKDYHIGSWWDETGGYDSYESHYNDYKNDPDHLIEKEEDFNKFTNRHIPTRKNYSVIPFSYVKKWDGSIFNITQLNAGGLKGWPDALSVGLSMLGGIETSFFNNRLYVGISRKPREWGAMDNGAGLALNANARPFLGMEASLKLFDWLSFSSLTGFLEFPNNGDLNEAWYVPDENGKPTLITPNVKDSYFFQNLFAISMMNFDFKYFHFDFGSTVIFPKRIELGYMFPIFEKLIYQNNLGDYDNLGIFGSISGRLPGLGSIWISGFIDEINVPNIKTMFNDSRCMFALQAGLKSIFPILPFGKISFRYTRIEPFCYTHPAVKIPYYSNYVSTAYINNGSSLGYYLDPNSDEFFLRIEAKPITNLDLGLQYQLIRHGATWGDMSVEGSSIYSELPIYGRSSRHKYFLHDGAYEWTNIVMLDGAYDLRSHGLPMKFIFSAGYIYDWFTESGKHNEPQPMKRIEKDNPLYDQYPTTNGVVLSLGFKFFSF